MIGAFGDERYWLAWLAAEYGTDATLDSIQVGADGSVEGACTFALPQDQLPSVVTRVYKSDVQITRGESWSAIAGGGGHLHHHREHAGHTGHAVGQRAAHLAPRRRRRRADEGRGHG
jgi:Protein of unknown function (DUF2505)